MTTSKQKVVSVGADEELDSMWLPLLTKIMRRSESANGHCEVLMCYSLSSSVRERLAQIARRFSPLTRIIGITNTRLEKPEFADTFVCGVDGREALIEAIRG